MSHRPRRRLRGALHRAALVAVLGSFALVAVHDATSAGGEASPGGPAPVPVIDHPFLLALAGTYDVTVEGGPPGAAPTSARSSFRLSLGGTTLLHDWDGATPMGALHGHGIYRVNRDGRGLTCWWFDSRSRDPIKMLGPLTEAGAELSGAGPQGAVTIVWRRGKDAGSAGGADDGADDGADPAPDAPLARLDFRMTVAGVEVMRQTYRRVP